MAQDFISYYKPSGPVLEAYHRSWNYFNIICGPLGSGKTIASADKIYLAMHHMPKCKDGVRRSRFYAVRNTVEDLRRTTIKDWFQVVPQELGKWNASSMLHTINYIREDDGSEVQAEIQFLAFDLPKSLKKFRGSQLSGVWFNEVKELSRSIIIMGLSRTGRYPTKEMMPLDKNGKRQNFWYGGIGDTNSQDDDHYLSSYEEGIEEGTITNWSFFRQAGGVTRVGKGDTFVPNPKAENLVHLPTNYYENQMQGNRADWIAVNLANEIGITTENKPVHNEYNDHIHSPADVDIDYVVGEPVYMGVDYGRTPAAVFLQEIDGGYDVFDIFPMFDAGAGIFGREMRNYLARKWGIADVTKVIKIGHDDPSGGQKGQDSENTPRSILRSHGFNMLPAPCINQDVARRRKALTDVLVTNRPDGQPRLRIARRCKMLRKGLAGKWYHRRVQVAYDEMYADEPTKNDYSHVCEALEYALLGRGEGAIATPAGGNPRRKKNPHTRERPATAWNS